MGEATIAGIVETSIQVGAFALVAWLVRRVFQHTIPRLSGDFKEALGSQRDLFKEELRAQREDFKESLKAQLESFQNCLHAEREYLAKRIDRLSDNVEELVKELRSR
jgi:hypothetical protein